MLAFGGRQDRGGVLARWRSRAPSNSKLASCQRKHFENETSLQSLRDNQGLFGQDLGPAACLPIR